MKFEAKLFLPHTVICDGQFTKGPTEQRVWISGYQRQNKGLSLEPSPNGKKTLLVSALLSFTAQRPELLYQYFFKRKILAACFID